MSDEHDSDAGAPKVTEHPGKALEHGTKKAAGGIKGIFTKKIGPLPIGLWVLGIGGGLFIATYLRRSSQNAATSIDGYDATDTAGTGGAAASEPGYTGSGGAGSATGTGVDPYAVDPATYPDGYADTAPAVTDAPEARTAGGRGIKDNDTWRRRVIKAATADGVRGLVAQRAVDNYLAGRPLNKRQTDVINKGLASVGATPKPVPTPRAKGGGHGPGQTPPGGNTKHQQGNQARQPANGARPVVTPATHSQAAHAPQSIVRPARHRGTPPRTHR